MNPMRLPSTLSLSRSLAAVTMAAGALLVSCAAPASSGGGAQHEATFAPGSSPSAEARRTYTAGWAAIMDEGRWTLAEERFRAASAAAPEWVLGRTLVGRITGDVEEREEILAWVEANLETASLAERFVLDAFVLNLQSSIARGRGEKLPEGFRERLAESSVEGFRAYLRFHPDDVYIAAELVEWIHSTEGAEAALAAMDEEVRPTSRGVPFFLGYRVNLLAELGRIEEAREAADAHAALLADPTAPAVHTVRGRVLLAAGELEEARENAARAVQLDPQNLSAAGLLRAIEARLSNGDE